MVVKDFEIQFSGLKLGEHSYDYQLNKEFFDLFDYQGLEKSHFEVKVILHKKSNSLELSFNMDGKATVACDLTNEEFDLPLRNHFDLLVKYGEEYDDTNEDVLIIPYGDHSINISQYLYELAVLAMPLKKVHPEVSSGKRGQEVLKLLEELQPGQEEIKTDDETDPRWDKLKKLLN